MRDPSLVRALRQLGHNAMVIPMYLPVAGDYPDIAGDVPVFFGGVNVYLQQVSGFFRKTPRWFDRLLDSRFILRTAAHRSAMTSAHGMGKMTLSVLHGETGNQAKEVNRLVEWLSGPEKPDAIHLSTIMLAGVARRLKRELDIPVVASFQDEHVWLDFLEGNYPARCWEAIEDRAADVDAFVFYGKFYRDFIMNRINISENRSYTVNIGIDLSGRKHSSLPSNPPVVGYLSRITPSLGLEDLVEAFIRLKKKKGLERTRLEAMGGIVGKDRKFVKRLRRRLAAAGMGDDAVFHEETDMPSRKKFLASVSVLSVPVQNIESAGFFVLEGWAAGVPAVQPAVGTFPELLKNGGGGILCKGNDVNALTGALATLLADPEKIRELGRKGREAVENDFNINRTAQSMLEIYRRIQPA